MPLRHHGVVENEGWRGMSDASQGPGWWLASDGKWYPPDAGSGTGGPTLAGAGAPVGAAAGGGGTSIEATVNDVIKKLHPFGLVILAVWIAVMVLLLMVGLST